MLYNGFIHLTIILIYSLYYFLAPYKYDKYMFTFLLSLFLHWVCLNGECIISYMYKKNKNNNYKPGDDPTNMEDFIELSKYISLKTGINYIYIYNLILLIMYISIILLFYRFIKYKTIKPVSLLYINIIFLFVYMYNIRKYKNETINKIYSIVLLISIVYMIKNKNF